MLEHGVLGEKKNRIFFIFPPPLGGREIDRVDKKNHLNKKIPCALSTLNKDISLHTVQKC
jgi:hypothetical protein